MTDLSYDLPKATQDAINANLMGANKNAQAASETGDDFRDSLMSPEEMKQMRADARLAISRGASNLANMGEVGGLQAPDWKVIQNLFGSRQYQFGDMKSNPIFDFNGLIEAANDKSLQNRAIGLADTDKVAPLTSALEQQGEGSYNSAVNLQNLFNPNLVPQIESTKAGNISAIANAGGIMSKTQQEAGNRGDVKIHGGGLSNSNLTISSPYQNNLDVSKLPPEVQSYGGQYNSMMNPNQSNDNLTKEAAKNKQILLQGSQDYSPTGPKNPEIVAKNADNFNVGLKVANNDGTITTLNSNGKEMGVSPDEIGKSVSANSFFTALGQKVGAGSTASFINSKLIPLLPSFSEKEQNELAQAAAAGTLDINGLKSTVDRLTNNAQSNYYKYQAFNAIADNNSRYNAGQVSSDALQSTLNSSYALNSPNLLGKNKVSVANGLTANLQALKKEASDYGWDDDRLRAEQMKTITKYDKIAQDLAKQQDAANDKGNAGGKGGEVTGGDAPPSDDKNVITGIKKTGWSPRYVPLTMYGVKGQ